MGLIEKIETFLNDLLFKLGALIAKLTPQILKKSIKKLSLFSDSAFRFLKSMPPILWERFQVFLKKNVAQAKQIDFRKRLGSIANDIKSKNPKAGKFKTFFLLPFKILALWLQGLSPGQVLLLLSFTGGSILALIGIGFSGKKMALSYLDTGRFPASEEVLSYDRPDYYKKDRRHAMFVNLRLPVYFAQINEVKNVDIDFTVTLSNRNTRMFIEKHDFKIRDHLILQIEPSVASFPIEEEGKQVIKNKLLVEINEFLKQHEIEGTAEEVNLTYILAN